MGNYPYRIRVSEDYASTCVHAKIRDVRMILTQCGCYPEHVAQNTLARVLADTCTISVSVARERIEQAMADEPKFTRQNLRLSMEECFALCAAYDRKALTVHNNMLANQANGTQLNKILGDLK